MRRFTNRIKVTSALAALLLASLPLSASVSASHSNDPEYLLKTGHADEAINLLQKRLNETNFKMDATSYNLLCRVYLAVQKLDNAVKACETSVRLDPTSSQFHLWLGRAYGMKAEKVNPFSAFGLARRAREQFEKAVELNGDDTLARTDLAEFYFEAPGIVGGGKDKALQQAETMQAKDAAAAYWVKAKVAEKNKDAQEAEDNFKKAIEASGNDAEMWVALASFYRRQERMEEMDWAINRAVDSQKAKTNAFVDAASVLYRAGRSLPLAAQLLVKYLSGPQKTEEAPAFQAHFLLGQILEKQGDRDGARKQYEEALKLAKDYAPAKDALKHMQEK